MSHIPVPHPCILDEFEKVRGRKRWRDPDSGRLFEWDSLHGEVEVYSKLGIHMGAINPVTGVGVKPPKKGRSIDV